MNRVFLLGLLSTLVFFGCAREAWAAGEDNFSRGVEAYRKGEYAQAVEHFQSDLEKQPASGAFVNLGLAEWQRGHVGAAVLAWERARWVDPFNRDARDNLAYARQLSIIAPPDYSWHEHISAWLPINAWAWIAGVSLWLAVGMVILPGVLRWRRAAWQQAVAALALTLFLVSLPAHYGVLTRTKIGFALEKNLPLRLTPTAEGEVLTKLASGDPVRALRKRGEYVLVRTVEGQGWVKNSEVGWVCPE